MPRASSFARGCSVVALTFGHCLSSGAHAVQLHDDIAGHDLSRRAKSSARRSTDSFYLGERAPHVRGQMRIVIIEDRSHGDERILAIVLVAVIHPFDAEAVVEPLVPIPRRARSRVPCH